MLQYPLFPPEIVSAQLSLLNRQRSSLNWAKWFSASAFKIKKNEDSSPVFHEFLGYVTKEEEEDVVEDTILTIARLDA